MRHGRLYERSSYLANPRTISSRTGGGKGVTKSAANEIHSGIDPLDMTISLSVGKVAKNGYPDVSNVYEHNWTQILSTLDQFCRVFVTAVEI